MKTRHCVDRAVVGRRGVRAAASGKLATLESGAWLATLARTFCTPSPVAFTRITLVRSATLPAVLFMLLAALLAVLRSSIRCCPIGTPWKGPII